MNNGMPVASEKLLMSLSLEQVLATVIAWEDATLGLESGFVETWRPERTTVPAPECATVPCKADADAA